MNARNVVSNLSPSELQSYVERGILRVTMTEANIPMCIEDTPEYHLFKKFKGKKIAVSEAGRKYKVSPQNISNWKNKGFIPVLGNDGQKILLDESYVAYCVYIYLRNPSQGRWAFNPNGTPRTQGVNLRK